MQLDQAIDPQERQFAALCGRTFPNTNADFVPQVSYKQRALQLCTDACLHAFEATLRHSSGRIESAGAY